MKAKDLETSQAELEALEREPRRPAKKKSKKRAGNGPVRDERGRFTAPEKKSKNAAR